MSLDPTQFESEQRFMSSRDTKTPLQWPFGGCWGGLQKCFQGMEAEDKVSLVRGEEQVIYRYHINYFFKNLTYRKDKERMTIPRLG